MANDDQDVELVACIRLRIRWRLLPLRRRKLPENQKRQEKKTIPFHSQKIPRERKSESLTFLPGQCKSNVDAAGS